MINIYVYIAEQYYITAILSYSDELYGVSVAILERNYICSRIHLFRKMKNIICFDIHYQDLFSDLADYFENLMKFIFMISEMSLQHALFHGIHLH